MALSERIGIIVPGQDAALRVDPSWASADNMHAWADEVRALWPNVDAYELLATNEKDRPKSVQNAHLLMAAVGGYVARRLGTVEQIAAVSGHSLGLPVSLGFTSFYTDGIRGMASVLSRRAESYATAKGAMYTVIFSGPDGFSTLAQWEASQSQGEDKKIYVACYNLETQDEAIVTVSAGEGVDVGKTFTEGFKKQVRVITLPIPMAGHSPWVTQSQQRFTEFLADAKNRDAFRPLPQNGAIFISDHRSRDAASVAVTRDHHEIAAHLGELTNPVWFQEMIVTMDPFIDEIWEVGSSGLSGLIDSMTLGIRTHAVQTPQDLERIERRIYNRSG